MILILTCASWTLIFAALSMVFGAGFLAKGAMVLGAVTIAATVAVLVAYVFDLTDDRARQAQRPARIPAVPESGRSGVTTA